MEFGSSRGGKSALVSALYPLRVAESPGRLVVRAETAGAEAIALTVDAPGLGTRERDVRNSFTLPEGLPVANVTPLGKGSACLKFVVNGLAAYVHDDFKGGLGFLD